MLEIKITIHCPDLVTAAALLVKQAVPSTAPIPASSSPPGAAIAPAQPTPRAPVTPGPVPTTPSVALAPPAAPAPTAPTVPAPTVPVTVPTYTLDQIAKAGAALVDAGKMEQLLALLGKYGVAAVTQLTPEQYGNFATELRALGAQI